MLNLSNSIDANLAQNLTLTFFCLDLKMMIFLTLQSGSRREKGPLLGRMGIQFDGNGKKGETESKQHSTVSNNPKGNQR